MSGPDAGAAPGRTFPELCRNAAHLGGSRVAVIDDRGRQLSYDALLADAGALARGLRSIGGGAGGTVGLLAPNSTDWVVSALGCHLAGSAVAAFHTWVKPHDLDFLLRHSGVSTLIVASDVGGRDLLSPLAALVPALADEAPDTWRSERYLALRRVVVMGDSPLGGAHRWDAVLEAGRAEPDVGGGEPVGAADVAFVLYTSGSTADPKGVPLLHGDMVDNGFWIGERMGLGPTDRVWLGSPLFWSFGSANAMVATFSHRATLVLQEKFDAERAAAQIAEQRCTAAYLLPALAHAFADMAGVGDAFATVRTGLTIGRPDEVRAVAEGLGVAGICNVYGSTETYGNCCVTPHDMPLDDRVRCQGPPLPGMELRIVDPNSGEEVAPGEEGAVLVRGRITPAYLDAEELNAETFDADGWYHTGDIGRIDEAGCFVFTTRDSDMIKTNGINVSPAEVEVFLLSDPDVAEAVVVGAPDAVRGEVVVAFVRAAPGAALDAEAIIARCQDELAGYKVPRAVHVVSEMPQTATGKLSRKQLRQLLVDAEATR